MKTILIIDANAIMHRAFHALPELNAPDGTPINAVYGFFTMMHRALASHQPHGILFCFDTPTPTFRKKLLPSYQEQRPTPPDSLKTQFALVRKFLDTAKLARLEQPGFEADDVIGSACVHPQLKTYHKNVISGDRDLLQLASNHTTIELLKTGLSKTVSFTPQIVQETYHLSPEQIPDLKALSGDASDNYQAIKGLGPKTATKLLHQFGSLEQILAHRSEIVSERLRQQITDHQDDLKLLKTIASIKVDISITIPDSVYLPTTFPQSFYSLLTQYELKTLRDRFFPKKPASQTEYNTDKDQLSLM